MTGRQPGHGSGGLGYSPMRPSAKRALFVGLRGLNADTTNWRQAFSAGGRLLLRGGGRAVWGLLQARHGGAVVRWVGVWSASGSNWCCCGGGAVGRGPGRRGMEERTPRSGVGGGGTEPHAEQGSNGVERRLGPGRGLGAAAGWPVLEGGGPGRRWVDGALGGSGRSKQCLGGVDWLQQGW